MLYKAPGVDMTAPPELDKSNRHPSDEMSVLILPVSLVFSFCIKKKKRKKRDDNVKTCFHVFSFYVFINCIH